MLHSISLDTQKQGGVVSLGRHKAVEIDNKIVITNLNKVIPSVLRVYKLIGNNPYYDEAIKEEIYYAERTYDNGAPSFINGVYNGEGTVIQYSNDDSADYKRYAAAYQRSQGTEGKGNLYDDSGLENGTGNTGGNQAVSEVTEFEADALDELDRQYAEAVESGDKATYMRLLKDKASVVQAKLIENPDTLTYTVRRGSTPNKTLKVYKTFTVDKNGNPSALFVSNQNSIPVGVWLNAQDTFHFTAANGRQYVPSTKNPNTKGKATGRSIAVSKLDAQTVEELKKRGYIKDGAKAITALAYRPGWHAGDLPFFPQGGMKVKGSNYANVHRYNQVVYECEMAYDVDYTASKQRKGKTVFFDRQEMPTDGLYKFATNPMAQATDIGAWYISGALKINRPLTESECNRILEANNRLPQEWQIYQDKTAKKSR